MIALFLLYACYHTCINRYKFDNVDHINDTCYMYFIDANNPKLKHNENLYNCIYIHEFKKPFRKTKLIWELGEQQ